VITPLSIAPAEAMVLGDLPELITPHAVQARITDLRHRHLDCRRTSDNQVVPMPAYCGLALRRLIDRVFALAI